MSVVKSFTEKADAVKDALEAVEKAQQKFVSAEAEFKALVDRQAAEKAAAEQKFAVVTGELDAAKAKAKDAVALMQGSVGEFAPRQGGGGNHSL